MTPKLLETYRFIRAFIMQNDFAPTCSEIAKGIGIKSRGVVYRYLSALSKEGAIRMIPGQKRNIELLDVDNGAHDAPFDQEQQHNSSSACLPILGNIAAGNPIEAIEQGEFFNLSEELVRDNRFILRVKGDSMIGDNICDGDYVICEKCKSLPNNHAIAVILVENQEATLKRIQINQQNGTIALIPSNPEMMPMIYPASSVMIQGVYVGLIRL